LVTLRASAKVWIFEDEVQDQMSATEPAIDYPLWLKATTSGTGLLAPHGKKLHIMGGWIWPTGLVAMDPKKEHRSIELHETGYS
jgi:hypothetical protein